MTDRWMRSRDAEIFGVVAGFAKWRDLPVDKTRFIVFLLVIFTSIFPGVLIYLALAAVLPLEGEGGYQGGEHKSFKGKRKYRDAEDASFSEKSTEDLKREYESLKKKVEEMESEMFDKEKDWDERFREGESK